MDDIKSLQAFFPCRNPIPIFGVFLLGLNLVLLLLSHFIPSSSMVTDSTLQDVTPYNVNRMHESSPLASGDITAEFSPSSDVDMAAISPPNKLVQCRICHDEDEGLNLEAPCSCNGSLKYAHRNCVQRWCNEKGDTDCEICLQQFRPNYIAPPPSSRCNGTPPSFRGITWDILGRDLHDYSEVPPFDYEGYSYPNGLVCCRIVAINFLALVVLRYTLPVVLSGVGEYSLTLFTVLVLRALGFLLLIYIMTRVFSVIRRRQRESDPQSNLNSDEEENELPVWQTSSGFVQVG